jgi:hypothetical protein
MNPCLICGGENVEEVLDLGETALANKFLTEEELTKPEPKFVLRLGFCNDCGHVQLTDIVPPGTMFDDYLYMSSASDTLKEHLYDLSDIVANRLSLGSDDLVVDIGCNDGTLLEGFHRHQVRTLGVDPARNLAGNNGDSTIERCVALFDSTTAERILKEWGPARAITLTNTFPHIQDLSDFLKGVRTLLTNDGVLVIEAHYLLDLLAQGAFDTIYHEHVSYWALGPMMKLFESARMKVLSAERLPIHHGQLRVFVGLEERDSDAPSISEILQQERAAGVDKIETFRAFRDSAMDIKEDLQRTLRQLRKAEKQVVAYGAPAKGNTLLEFLDIGPDLVEYIVDRSPLKQGRYTPGTHIPVLPTERLLEDQPDYVLLLAWNFVDEVLRQQQEYRNRGGKFIMPVPTVRIIE